MRSELDASWAAEGLGSQSTEGVAALNWLGRVVEQGTEEGRKAGHRMLGIVKGCRQGLEGRQRLEGRFELESKQGLESRQMLQSRNQLEG
jgi:hypothetical protein